MPVSRRPLIAGNWKMNGTLAGAGPLALAISEGAAGIDAQMAICPPFPHIPAVAAALAQGPVALGAQDVSAHDAGAYTGEVCASMLVGLGCSYVIVGHSERREYHDETSEDVRAKAEKAIAAGLVPIICVGETREQRESGSAPTVIAAQIAASVPPGATGESVVIAYEPVWAIGTGLVATTAQIAEVHAQIRGLLEKQLAGADNLRIIYGGSVKPENAAEILQLADVDGALAGGASLKAESFLAIAKAAV